MLLSSIVSGVVFGLAAGISPGPLLTLVMTETLRHGKSAGVKVAMAPLVTDAPIILAALLVFSWATHLNVLLGLIAFAGGMFVAWLGYESITTKELVVSTQVGNQQSLTKGVLANLLNPHPYLFWLTVGAPLIVAAYQDGLGSAAAFLAAFFLCLVGCKVLLALIVDSARVFLKSQVYVWIMRGLGVVLFWFAVGFIQDGLHYFKLSLVS